MVNRIMLVVTRKEETYKRSRPFLAFDHQAEVAARYYVPIFSNPNS